MIPSANINELSRLLRFSSAKSRPTKLIVKRGKKAPAAHHRGPDFRLYKQRVVVKSSIRKLRNGDTGSLHATFKKHVHYIGRDGTGIDGKKPEVFTRVDGQALPTQKLEKEERFFKFIVSPEKGSEIDLKEYTRDIMKDAEKSIGKKLDWLASCHYNTDNPHVHIVVRGIAEGKELFLDRQFISEQFRFIASDRATLELGHRTSLDIAAQKTREIGSERFTSIDRQLVEMKDKHNVVEPRSDYQKSRCDHLVCTGLAISYGKNLYRLADNFDQILKENGYRDDIHKRMYHDIPDNQKPVFLYKDTMTIQGKIVSKELENEHIEKPYVFIETKDKIYYVADYKLDRFSPGQEITLDKGKISRGKEIEKGIEK